MRFYPSSSQTDSPILPLLRQRHSMRILVYRTILPCDTQRRGDADHIGSLVPAAVYAEELNVLNPLLSTPCHVIAKRLQQSLPGLLHHKLLNRFLVLSIDGIEVFADDRLDLAACPLVSEDLRHLRLHKLL
jgi:hypothetical protein